MPLTLFGLSIAEKEATVLAAREGEEKKKRNTIPFQPLPFVKLPYGLLLLSTNAQAQEKRFAIDNTRLRQASYRSSNPFGEFAHSGRSPVTLP